MHVAVFGGAFDPIHLGHCAIIDHLLQSGRFDRVCVVPTGIPVFKKTFLFSSLDRLNFLQILYKDHPKVIISDYEVKKLTTSYMKETLDKISKQLNEPMITLVIGYDQFMQFHQWKFYQDILSAHKLLVVFREGVATHKDDLKIHPELARFDHQIQFSDVHVPDVSSTEIRDCIQKNKDISTFVHPEIYSVLRQ